MMPIHQRKHRSPPLEPEEGPPPSKRGRHGKLAISLPYLISGICIEVQLAIVD